MDIGASRSIGDWGRSIRAGAQYWRFAQYRRLGSQYFDSVGRMRSMLTYVV